MMIANGTAKETIASNDNIGGNSGGGGGVRRRSLKDVQKQPPDKLDSTSFASALEMTKVNSTANVFAGGKQKPWMWNNNPIPAVPVPTTIRPQTNPPKRKTTPLDRQRSTAAGVRNSLNTTDDGRGSHPILATVGPGKSPPSTAPSSLSPDLRVSMKRKAPTGSMDTVLPSPAPSDTPSVTDRREDEDEVVIMPAVARDTPIASPVVVDDSDDDPRCRLDDQSGQSELSSGITGSGDVVNVTGTEEYQQRSSAKRGLGALNERPENSKRQRQSSFPDRVEIEASNRGLGEQGSGSGLGTHVQSPIIDSRQTSPTYSQQLPPIPQGQTPTVPSNVSPIAAHNRTPLGSSLQSPRMSSGGSPLPLLYSTSLPLTTSSPLTQSPMIASTAPAYGSQNMRYQSLQPDQHPWVSQDISLYQDSGMPSPGVIRSQQQQQLLQEQAQHPPRRPPASSAQQLAGPENLMKLTTHLPMFDQYIHTEGGTGLRQFNSVECFRFRILREAVTNNDWFFTILNQVYALMSTSEESLQHETNISANLPGFKALPDILHDNQRLSGRNLMYLSIFPMPFSEAKLRLPSFPALLIQVKEFLKSGYKVIANMKNYYFRQGKVPTAEEIEQSWNLPSPVFRHILIRYLQHHVTKLLEASHIRTLEQQKLLQDQRQQQQQQATREMFQNAQQQGIGSNQPQNMAPQRTPSAAELASYQQRLSASQQYQQIAMNAQALQQTSPAPQYATPPSISGVRPPGGPTNRAYLQMVQSIAPPGQSQQPHPQRPVPQRAISHGQRLSNPSSRRGVVSAGLSIDTERAQQQLRAARFIDGNRNHPYPPGSANTSPMPTPTSLPMASPQYGAIQQSLGGPPSRRNSLQRPVQMQSANAGRRTSLTPIQQSFVAPPQQQPSGTPERRQSYAMNQSQPTMVCDTILNTPIQSGLPSWSQQVGNALMSGTQLPQMTHSTMQHQHQHPERASLQQGNVSQALANGMPIPSGVTPIPMPVRASYAGLPQHALQSHLLSPRFAEPPQVNGKPPPRSKLYISITGFAFQGIVIDFSKPCQIVKFNVEEEIEKRLSKMRPGNSPGDGLTRPMVVSGSLIYRLRAVKWTKNDIPGTPDKEWVSRETDWPSNTFIEVNENRVELRRKPAWGKDLPADITTYIRTGENEIKIVVLCSKQTNPHATLYAMAVEVHECSHEDQITAGLQHITPTDAKTLITSRLVTKADGDDLMVVDSNELALSVTCPLSFTLMNTPVRGHSCPHLECFDFRNFLDSRPRRKEWEPPNSDAWRCPICRGDARPGELVVDGFLVGVLRTLREAHADGEDPRHIIVKKDGSWEVKSENDTNNEKEEKEGNNGTGGANPKKEVEIICLDDDDD